MTESSIERFCCAWAERAGWLQYKVTSPGKRGLPDRVFMRAGRVLWVEFKSPRGTLSASQCRRIAEIEDEDVEVYVIGDCETFIAMLGESE